MRTYELWQKGPWDLPKPGKGKDSSVSEEPKKEPPGPRLVSTKNIIEKNLFDPERGAGRTQEAEASSIAMQRIRSMVLMGIAIIGNSRYAILQEPSDPRASAPRIQTGQPGQLRLKLGDTVEGFELSEIHEKRVVFTKGASKVEFNLDFFRKVEEPMQKATGPTPPQKATVPTPPQKATGPTPPGRTPRMSRPPPPSAEVPTPPAAP